MKKFFEEFKKFALKGNMLDLAIGVIIGASFNSVVTSIVNDMLMPLIGIIIGGTDFSGLCLTIGDAKIQYGLFIQNVVNLLIVAFCLFLIVKTMNIVKSKLEKAEEAQEEAKPAEKPADIVLLEEIRDTLVSLNDKK